MKRGKSQSAENPLGSRKVSSNGVLAPKRFRKMGRRLMSDVSDNEIAKNYCGIDNFDAVIAANEKSVQSHKGQITKLEKALVEGEDNSETERKIAIQKDSIDAFKRDSESMRSKIRAFREA